MKISVIICTYNGEKFISEQLISIAEQTRAPYEVIICDDRSNDMTLECVRRIKDQTDLPCQMVRNETRLGVEENFSKAMFIATGDVLFFCDQDDVWLPNKLAEMVAPFEDNSNVSLVYSDGVIVGPELEFSGYTLFSAAPKKELQNGALRDIGERLCRGRSPGIKASSIAFSAQVRDNSGPVPDGVSHDSWIVYFGYALGKVVVIREPLYYYRRHNTTSGKSSTNRLFEELELRETRTSIARLKAKSRFACYAYDRMKLIESKGKAEARPSKHFTKLKKDALTACEILKVRLNIISNNSRVKRAIKGLIAIMRGKYLPYHDVTDRWKALYGDIKCPRAIR